MENYVTIPHATVKQTEDGRIEILMEKGWVFYDSLLYPFSNPLDEIPENILAELTEKEKETIIDNAPAPKIPYSRYGNFSSDYDFSNVKVVKDNKQGMIIV